MTPPPVSRALHDLAVVGKEIPKADAGSKVTAQAQYIHDLELPGMLWGRIKYSDRASARIVSIDTSAAEAMPGVKSVITAYNTPELRIGFIKDNTVLKKDRVRQYRDEIAAVAATSREIAEAAIAAITVEYVDLPAVFDVDEALLPDAPLVHETDAKGEPVKDNRLRLPWKFNHGDVEAGEAASAFVVEGEYETGWVTHICMGTSGCVASFDTDQNLTMHSVTQIPSLAKADFHEALRAWGIPGNVRVVNSVVGGGFGSKLDTYAFEYIAILLAHRTRRPVKILFDREEEFIATSPRQPFKMKVRQGCDAEGRLTFRDVTCLLDNGAYTSWGATTPSVAMMPAVNLYRVPNVRFKATCAYTNNTYSQAMRGYGTPQITFALECSMDELAEKAGIDPYELRLRNANRSGEVTPQGFLATTCGHKECLEEVATRLRWNEKRGRTRAGEAGDATAAPTVGDVTPVVAPAAGPTDDVAPAGTAAAASTKKRGVGMACLMHVGGGAKIYKSDGCGTLIKVDDFGKIDVYSGSMDIGQGLDTVLRQIVAETLGVKTSAVNVVIGDTDVCPWDVGVHASRSTFIAGNAALGAARLVREQILQFAAGLLDEPVEALDLQDGKIVALENPEKTQALDRVLRKAHFAGRDSTMFMAAHFYEPPTDLPAADMTGNYSAAYTWGCHGVEVEVDTETGEVQILDYVAAHDVGRAINPLLLRGQVYGAAVMGVGFALMEEMVYHHGRLVNPNMRDYKVLTAADAVPVQPIMVELPDASGPYGAKGVGEPGLVPTAPAIANAIYDAVGIRMHKLPMKPEKVLRALREAEGRPL